MAEPKVLVIGSMNMDLVTTTSTFPKQGETVMGETFSTIPGGKGANQAVAASRLGADVTFIGCVGEDLFGETLIKNLHKNNVNSDSVTKINGVETGVAAITIAEHDNNIIVVPGANDQITPTLIEQYEQVIAEHDMLLLQFEIPIDSVAKAITIANKHRVKVVLNPAPVKQLPVEVLKQVDFLIPNEHEVSILGEQLEAEGISLTGLATKIIVTKGKDGVLIYPNEIVPSFAVKATDTTGAGDTFNGAFAVAIAQGKPIAEACQFANAAAALSVMKLGAQAGMPTEQNVYEFLKR
ncbi:ribokinase [Aquibacillus sediminis]|uniref:ribokinase n=1 Tax=Aquibacillus sediminis TaxID=2574734 RepID=UPI001107DC62|nr:ribokinase [Aquibacillus sediminis]